jgi:nucleoside-diphosphate-sugar epimerase
LPRVLVAGASGVIGRPLVPMLLEHGHVVAGLTRSNPDTVRALGAEPIVCDVYDLARLRELIGAFAPEVVVHLLTDLPDEIDRLPEFAAANARIRREGTRNLLAAAPGARFVAESIAFETSEESAAAVAELERLVPHVIRLDRLCGPGTYDPGCTGEGARIHVDDAARLFADAVGGL